MLSKLIKEYLEYADRELGYMEKTIYLYKYELALFDRYFGNVAVELITIDDMNSYFRSEEDRGLAVSSVNIERVIVRSFFSYCQYNLHIKVSFDCKMIRAKKCEQPDVRVASEEDLRRAMSVMESPQDKLIILVLSQTCMRIGELVKLQVEHINGTEVKTLGKGRKRRLVCITQELAAALQRHLIDNKIHTGPVFRSQTGKGYTVSGLRNRFIRKLQPHGIYAGFHWYRHGGATGLMRNGADLFFIKEYLGHSDIRTTQRYLHITDREKVQKFEMFYISSINISEVLT